MANTDDREKDHTDDREKDHTDDQKKVLLAKVAAVRAYLDITKVEFFRRLGIDWGCTKSVEDKVTAPDTIENICRTFRIDPAYFTDEMTVDQFPAVVDESVKQCSIDRRITVLREEKGITRQDLAHAVGVSGSFIASIERGERRVTREKAERIADYFNVGVDYLLTGDESRKNYPVNGEVISWLWEHEEWRKFLHGAMESGKEPEAFAREVFKPEKPEWW